MEKRQQSIHVGISEMHQTPLFIQKMTSLKMKKCSSDERLDHLLLLLNCILAIEAHGQKNPSYHVTQKAIGL